MTGKFQTVSQESYEVHVHYKSAANGNWSNIPEGWKVVGTDNLEQSLKTYNFFINNDRQTIYDDVRIIKVTTIKEVL